MTWSCHKSLRFSRIPKKNISHQTATTMTPSKMKWWSKTQNIIIKLIKTGEQSLLRRIALQVTNKSNKISTIGMENKAISNKNLFSSKKKKSLRNNSGKISQQITEMITFGRECLSDLVNNLFFVIFKAAFYFQYS